MRRLLHLLTRRMAVKIFLAMGLVVGQSLIVLAFLQSREEVARLRQATRVSAQQIGRMVQGSVEHAMLQGDGIAVKELVASFKEGVPDAEIHLYDRRGLEVFGPRGPRPAPSSLPAALLRTLRDGQRFVDAAVGATGRVYRPLPNEERCQRCHEGGGLLRGVLVFTPDAARLAQDRDAIAVDLVTAAFVHVMTARRAEQLDELFAEMPARSPSVRAVAVYDREGDLAFGKDLADVPREAIQAALLPGAARARLAIPGGHALLLPLAREARCAACHKDGAPVRGVLAVDLAAVAAPDEAEGLVDTTVRAIMMAKLGRIVVEYLHEVVATGAFGDLALHDDGGRTYFTARPVTLDAAVAAALGAAPMAPTIVGPKGAPRLLLGQRLENGPRCITCHGDDHDVRGAVMVSLPDNSAGVRSSAITRTVILSSLALGLILLMLYGFLKVLVDRPVREIGAVAQAVGQGDLTGKVSFADADGDEIKQLGSRINEMIFGLRTKFQLEKLVSRGAAAAAATSARTSASLGAVRASQRKHLTVLFSDIRGFTSFSETVPPETVVEMLNALLQAQSEVVERWGGDIDKYVGDELMAVFDGDDAARRAVRCGIEMIEAVARLKRPGQALGVGVGVAAGDMVYGYIGSEKRQDHTVIGDVVNTGARLCSAAPGGQVLVSRGVLDDCKGGLGDVEFNALPPIAVKNKREPLEVYSVTRVGPGSSGSAGA